MLPKARTLGPINLVTVGDRRVVCPRPETLTFRVTNSRIGHHLCFLLLGWPIQEFVEDPEGRVFLGVTPVKIDVGGATILTGSPEATIVAGSPHVIYLYRSNRPGLSASAP